ncbi:MAG: ImmA/IrrE family metallo-endopeptidase [Thiomicrospira sp.]|jgi:HTH-type transcriptional regulator/antitoxin HigA|nr:ImmA/IrrE family metallo-endopeptidase [Thiomicrospira sp.]
MEIRLIHTEKDYELAMSRLAELMDLDPELNTPESNELEVWATLIEKYESELYAPESPTPIEAIKFRMDQMGFNQNDMVEYFGSKAKASEVLNGKRNLTLSMMRKLVNGLGIPASVFLQDEAVLLSQSKTDWSAFPLKDMLKKGYFSNFKGKLSDLKLVAEEQIRAFLDRVPNSSDLRQPCMKTMAHGENDKEVNQYALYAWQVRVLEKCYQQPISSYEEGSLNLDFLKSVVHYSFLDEGPVLAQEFLAKNGIYMIVEEHLEQTYLDGAAFLSPKGNPVVALTLRYDRLDNFWFTLLHELAHIELKHVNKDHKVIYDSNLNPEDTSFIEKQANDRAKEAFGLNEAELMNVSQYSDIDALKRKYRISASIIIGQVRRIKQDYRLFSRKMGKVRYLFDL